MIRFLEIQSPNCRETLHRPLPKATLVCKNKKEEKTRRRRRTCTRAPSLSYYHHGNITGLIAAGQFVTSLDSSGSVIFEQHEHDNPHAHDNYNHNRIVRARSRQVMRKMWRVEQEHNIIRIFYYTRSWQQEGTAENTSGEPSYWPGWMSRPGARLSKACRNTGGS